VPGAGVRVEAVPFARHASGFTPDFEQLVAWLATKADKTTIKRLVRVDWDTSGGSSRASAPTNSTPTVWRICSRSGIDEVSWRKQHRYLTLVADHIRGQIVWGTEGSGQAAADRFFKDLGKPRSRAVEVISLDMGPGYAKSAGDKTAARRFKDARWSLLKAPKNLNENQAATLRRLKAPSAEESDERLEAAIGQTIRRHRDGILQAIRLGINQGRTEALNNKVRLITRRAYGFYSAQAALALVMLTCGSITLTPPPELHP
jgi:transposase